MNRNLALSYACSWMQSAPFWEKYANHCSIIFCEDCASEACFSSTKLVQQSAQDEIIFAVNQDRFTGNVICWEMFFGIAYFSFMTRVNSAEECSNVRWLRSATCYSASRRVGGVVACLIQFISPIFNNYTRKHLWDKHVYNTMQRISLRFSLKITRLRRFLLLSTTRLKFLPLTLHTHRNVCVPTDWKCPFA